MAVSAGSTVDCKLVRADWPSYSCSTVPVELDITAIAAPAVTFTAIVTADGVRFDLSWRCFTFGARSWLALSRCSGMLSHTQMWHLRMAATQ